MFSFNLLILNPQQHVIKNVKHLLKYYSPASEKGLRSACFKVALYLNVHIYTHVLYIYSRMEEEQH